MATTVISRGKMSPAWRDERNVWEGRCDFNNLKNSNLRLKESQLKSEQVQDELVNLRKPSLYCPLCGNMHLVECKLSCTQSLPESWRYPYPGITYYGIENSCAHVSAPSLPLSTTPCQNNWSEFQYVNESGCQTRCEGEYTFLAIYVPCFPSHNGLFSEMCVSIIRLAN